MFKSFKARKCVRQALAFVLSFVMVMSNIQVANVSAAESVTTQTYTLDTTAISAVDENGATIADKTVIAEGTVFADYFTVEGKVTQRVNADTATTKYIETSSNCGGAIAFTVSGTANVCAVVSSTGSSNTSYVSLQDSNGNIVENKEALATVSTADKTTLNYENLTAGVYRLVSTTADDSTRGVRIHSIAVVETVTTSGEDTSTETEDSTDVEMYTYSTTYNFCDESIVPSTTNGTDTVTSADGKLVVACGPSNAYQYNGTHGVAFKTGNNITISTLGNAKIVIGGCQYSASTATVTATVNGVELASGVATKTTGCYIQDTANAVEINYEGGEASIVLTFADTSYVPYIVVDRTEPKPVEDDTTEDVEMYTYDTTYNFCDESIVPSATNGTDNKACKPGCRRADVPIG